MKTLAIIPARGGSKRLKKKNLRPLGGTPLVQHTLDAVAKSGCVDRAILSSDDSEILALADQYPTIDPIPRPADLSGDTVTALELVNNIVSDSTIQEEYDVIALLLPTAPFRKPEHIIEGFKLLTEEVDGVVSLTSYEFPPQLSVVIEDDLVKSVFDDCPLITGNTRSQDQSPIYRPNGAFYIQWMKKFLNNRNFWKGKVRGYVMERLDSVDIDTEMDLAYAEFLLTNRS